MKEKKKLKVKKVKEQPNATAPQEVKAQIPRQPRKGETLVVIKHQCGPDEVKIVHSEEELQKVRQQLLGKDHIEVKQQDLYGATRVTRKSPRLHSKPTRITGKRQPIG